MTPPSYRVNLPGPPFGVIETSDQRWVFVSLAGLREGAPMGIAVLEETGGRFALVGTIPTPVAANVMVLTHDGKTLIASGGDAVIFADVDRMTRGDTNSVLGTLNLGARAANTYVNVTADDRILFVSEEAAAAIAVVNLEQIRHKGFDASAIIGKIPVGIAPIALTFSPDERWLYTTSELARPIWHWPKELKPEGSRPEAPTQRRVAEGAVIVIDVAKAKVAPESSVVARVRAGGSPVRLALSRSGDRLYETARGSDAVLVFDTAKLLSDPDHARIATVPVGSAPVPLVLVDGDSKLVVGNSDRFKATPDSESTLTVIDVGQISEGAKATLGTIRCGAFPRELRLSPDGHTLFLTNFLSRSLQVISVEGDLGAAGGI